KPWVQLAELATDRRDADGVLEQATRVVVVAVGCGGQRAQAAADLRVAEETLDGRPQALVRDLAGEVLEEPVQLVRVAPHRGREAGRVCVRLGLDRLDVELEPVAEALDATEDPHGVTLAEARV